MNRSKSLANNYPESAVRSAHERKNQQITFNNVNADTNPSSKRHSQQNALQHINEKIYENIHVSDQPTITSKQSDNSRSHPTITNHPTTDQNQSCTNLHCTDNIAADHNLDQNYHHASSDCPTPGASSSPPSTTIECLGNRNSPAGGDDNSCYARCDHMNSADVRHSRSPTGTVDPCPSTTMVTKTSTTTTTKITQNGMGTTGEPLTIKADRNDEHRWINTDAINDKHQSIPPASQSGRDKRGSVNRVLSLERRSSSRRQRTVVRKFQKLDASALTSTPAPDVKIGQRVAYKEYYGSEFGTIRWIGRVPQISPDWTVGVEFDNAIGEGDGSLNGRRYFIAKDCFAKFLPLDGVALVDQHVGRPEPGTMISVMSAAVRPGQMISIQRVSTVHVQHCFLNAPHRRPGAEFLAVNTRLHCQCPNCGPCAHVVKPPRTQRLRLGKNATHMCQFSTYTCCGMESQEEALCTYTGNRISSTPPPQGFPPASLNSNLPPIGNSWMDGSGYLSNLQAEQRKHMPEEYRFGAAPEDIGFLNGGSKASFRRDSGAKHHAAHRHRRRSKGIKSNSNSRDISPISHDTERYKQMESHGVENRQGSDGTRGANLACDHQMPFSASDKSPPNGARNECKDLNCYGRSDDDGLRQRFATNSVTKGDYAASHPNEDRLSSASPRDSVESGAVEDYHNNGIGCELSNLGNEFKATTSVRDMNEIQENQHRLDSTSAKLSGPKASKVLHRDSIENRYLFPTDDAFDSTLEADLENLSQARYGQCTGARQNSTRNILKSLRSLVSCLSAKSNQSDFERHSEATMRVVGQSSNGLNKSQPEWDNLNRRSSHSCCRCDSVSAQGPGLFDKGRGQTNHYMALNSKEFPPPPPFDYGDDFPLAKHHPDFDLEKENSFASAIKEHGENQPPDYSRFESHRNREEDAHADGKDNSNGNMSSHNGGSSYQHRKHGSSGASSSYGCWSSCGGLGNGEIKAATATTKSTTIEQFRRQISSSSDCGFSSASQNSINLASSLPSCSPINSVEEEQRRMNQIYKKIARRLINSSASITNEDLSRLKTALFEVHSENCCLHTAQSDKFNYLDRQTLESYDCDQLLAEIIKKTYLDSSMDQTQNIQHEVKEFQEDEIQFSSVFQDAPVFRMGSVGCSKTNQIETKQIKDPETDINLNCGSNESTCNEPKVSSGVEGINLSPSESIKTTGLPKAFELKLTLSINSDGAKSGKVSTQSAVANYADGTAD